MATFTSLVFSFSQEGPKGLKGLCVTEPTRSTSISSSEYQAGSARNHKGLEFKGPVGDTGLQEWPGVEADGRGVY